MNTHRGVQTIWFDDLIWWFDQKLAWFDLTMIWFDKSFDQLIWFEIWFDQNSIKVIWFEIWFDKFFETLIWFEIWFDHFFFTLIWFEIWPDLMWFHWTPCCCVHLRLLTTPTTYSTNQSPFWWNGQRGSPGWLPLLDCWFDGLALSHSLKSLRK